MTVQHTHPQPVPPKRVVVLGASGFAGRNLINHLAKEGVSTLALSSADIDLADPKSVEILHSTVKEDDTLVLLSALTPDKGRDIGTMMRNLKMVEHICDFLHQNQGGCSHVIYMSSDTVYADSISLAQEDSWASPSSLYGLMHLVREQMLSYTLTGTGVPLLIVRPCALYGPGDTHNSYGPNRFLRSAQGEGEIVLFGEGEEQRDHVYIDDVSRLLSLCLSNRTEGTLNIATGVAISFYDLAQMIAEVCGVEGQAVHVECLPRQQPITHRHYDISATLKAFPSFQFQPLDLEGLKTLAPLMEPTTK